MSEIYDPEKRFNERAPVYDDEIENIIPGYRTLHDLSHSFLKSSLPNDSHLLICGSGTGKEAIEYALENPGWNIVGFDLAENMVKKAASKIEQNGLQNRIQLVHGEISKVTQEGFDGVTSLLVAHFIPKKDKEGFLREIFNRLKPGGRFIIADVCEDNQEHRFEEFISAWQSFQLQRRDHKDVEEMFKHVRADLNNITFDETVSLLEKTGFIKINHFWKSLLINGFIMEKPI